MNNPKKNIIDYTSQINKGLKFFVKNNLGKKLAYIILSSSLLFSNASCISRHNNMLHNTEKKQTLENKVDKNSFELKPYIGIGTLSTKEKDHQKATGHKVMTVVGVDLTKGEKFKKGLTFEYGAMGEPTDDDQEMIHDYLKLFLKAKYDRSLGKKGFTISPLIEFGGEFWRRNSPKGDKANDFFGDLLFLEVRPGIEIKNKNKYLEVKGILPVWSYTDTGHKPDGEIGYAVNAGIIFNKKVDFKLFYDRTRFDEDGTQTPFELQRYGCLIGFTY
ncbi:MAG: hypothetical protein KJ646_01915 [Nanoarchaeota archaeon]|nr:hypothetical protein [Nanoarchaeota archaeon]MBU4116840.1 hypothetical protein [Nanoarchaeota archaeon]